MSESTDLLTVDETVEILEQSECHRDLIRYIKRAENHDGTALQSSLRRALNYVTASKWADRGTQIEAALYEDGARGALACGNLDTTNTEICEGIVEDYHR